MARSTFRSQNVENTPAPDHFWKLRCRKKCTPLWREANVEVKMYKAHQVRTTFGSCDVAKVHTVVARSTFRSQNVQNSTCSRHFWRLRCRKSARSCGPKHISIKTPGVRTTFGGSDVASLHYTTVHYTRLHSTTLRSTTLHYITQHYNYNYTTTLHYTPLHSATLNYITLHYMTLHYTPLHYITLHCTTFHYTSLHYTTLHYTTTTTTTTQLHSTTIHSTTLHYIKLHYTPLHYTTLHYTTLH